MSTKETWRRVPSVGDLLASSEGRLMIVPRVQETTHGLVSYGGYPTFGQWDGSRFIYARRGNKTLKVARLVCEAFNGTPPFVGAVCMHLDEDSRNNRPINLVWGTQKENLNATGFLDYCRSRTGENNPRIKAKRVKENV